MENLEIIHLWKSYQQKMDTAIAKNIELTIDIQKIKVKSMLATMKPVKIFTLLIGCLWVIAGTIILTNIYLYAFQQASKFFFYSAFLQVGLTAIAIIVYLLQLYWIQQIDVSESVMDAQAKIARLVSSTVWITKILFLQLPLWTTFYLSEAMFREGNMLYLMINGGVTLLFTAAALWLFVHIKFENRNKRWFVLLFKGKEWTPLMKSMEILDQIEECK